MSSEQIQDLRAELLVYRKQLAIATASFRKELAQQIMTTGGSTQPECRNIPKDSWSVQRASSAH